METRRIASLSLSLAAALTLTACAVSGSVKGTCSGSGCSVTGEVIFTPKEKLRADGIASSDRAYAAASATDLASFDAGATAIDTYGSTVPIPLTGKITIELRDSVSGATLAARQFDWQKVGSELRFSDPSFVSSWVQSNGAGADSMQYQVPSFTVAESAGETNTFATAMTYAGETLATSSYSWTSGGTSCRLCQVK